MKFACARVYERLQSLGCHPVAFRSAGGHGIHIYLIWDAPQDAYSVREFLRLAFEPLGFKPGAKGVAHGQIEIFPKQDSVEIGRAGNQFILPLAGQSVPLDPLFDFDPLNREDALDIQWKASAPVPLLIKPEVTRSASPPKQYTNGKLQELESALNSLTADTDYDDWLKVGMSTHYATGGAPEGLELWDSASTATTRSPPAISSNVPRLRDGNRITVPILKILPNKFPKVKSQRKTVSNLSAPTIILNANASIGRSKAFYRVKVRA